MPSRRRDIRIRRRRNGTRVARTLERREDGALAHGIAMRAAIGSQEGEARLATPREGDGHRDGLPVCPVRIRDGESWLRLPGLEVRRHESLDA